MVFENQICDRCHRPTVTRIMSMFNLDMICPACKEDERKHPLYELACASSSGSKKEIVYEDNQYRLL